MILEAGCRGGFWSVGSRGRFRRKVLEAVSGSVTMDSTALGPPGQSLGPRAETEKRTLRAARALVPGNPLTSHRGCFLRTSPAEAPPPGGWNPGCPWAVRGALFLPFPPAGGCQGRPHSPGAPRTRVGRAWLREPPPSRSGWPALLSVGVAAAADWAAGSFARSAACAPPLLPAGPPPPGEGSEESVAPGVPALATASRRTRPEQRAAMVPEDRSDGPGAGEESARLQAGPIRKVGALGGRRPAAGGRREVGSRTRPLLLPAAAGERSAAGSALVSRAAGLRGETSRKVGLTVGNWGPVRSQSPAAGLLSSAFGGRLLRRPEQVGAQVQLVVSGNNTPGPSSLAGAGLWSVTARGLRVCSWHVIPPFLAVPSLLGLFSCALATQLCV